MSKFNSKGAISTTSNLAGGEAFRMTLEIELVHAVLTTFLEDKYYETGADRITRIQDLIAKNKPEFVAKLAFVARTEFNLRSVSHLLLGELSKIHRGDSLIRNAIEKCAVRPDDLLEICSYVKEPIPNQVKKGIAQALLKFSPYQLAKYRGEGKDVSMVDLFNLCHPNPKLASKEQKKAWKDLMEGKLISTDTWESEMTKNPSKETWTKLIKEKKLGYMATIRNLNNFIKYDLSEKMQDAVVEFLTDPEKVKTSKQLPFRFYTAYKNVIGNRKFSDAISDAMDIAVSNAPEFKGKTLIAVDSSGSMNGGAIEKASIFAATLMKANKNADVILYDTAVKEFAGTSRSPVVDLADRINREAMGGGTDTALVFAYAYQNKKLYDRFIILSDNESWVSRAQQAYNEYKKETGTDPWVYAVDIQGYGTTDLASPKVKNLVGWSDRLLDFMQAAEKGESLITHIKSIKL